MSVITKAQWRAASIHNPHNLCSLGGGRVFIRYRSAGDRRSCIVPGWLVAGVGFSPDPKGHWADYGAKWFQRHELEAAQAWASDKFGIEAWTRDPFGAWQDAAVFARAAAKVKGATR